MASKKKTPPAPPPAAANPRSPSSSSSSASDEEDSSSDEDQEIASRPAAPLAPTLKRKAPPDSHSVPASALVSPTKTLTPAAFQKPTVESASSEEEEEEDDDDDSEEEEEENKEVEAADGSKLPTKVPQSEPESKKPKLSASPDQSLPHKSASVIQRIWSEEDELVLLRALSEYRTQHGKLPPSNEYNIILSRIIDLVSFPVTEKQISNKVRSLRYSYGQRMQKGSGSNISNPHEMLVFKMSAELFEDSRIASLKKSESSKTKNGARVKTKETTGHDASDTGVTHGDKVNKGTVKGSYFYLDKLIKSETEQLPKWISVVDDLVENIGESKAKDLETKTKELWMDAMKLHARKKKLVAKLFDVLSNGMVGNP